MAGTMSMLAHQVAGKAARDGFFLLEFEPSDLPKIVVTAALLSFGLAVLFSRLLERLGPALLIPAAFALSSLLHLAEWFLLPAAPALTVVLIYLHIVGLGAILLSGFWSLLSESFDPREAKLRFGRIAGAGTAGGIVGGIVAERLVAYAGTDPLLFFLAALHMTCALLSYSFNSRECASAKRPDSFVTAGEAFKRTPLLWRLAALVFLGTCTAALLDYLFKLGATITIGKGPALVRYFAVYYTGCQVLTFLIQIAASRWVLQRLGIARSVASLPLAVGGASAAALLIPVYPLVVIARAVEAILRGSLFRSGYELLYTPVPPADKRSVKTIVDVGCDRLGDAVGAGAVQVMVWLGPSLARPEILGLAILLAAASGGLALRMGAAYRGVLEAGLLRRSRPGDSSPEPDDATMNTVFEGMPSLTNFRISNEPQTPAPVTKAPPRPVTTKPPITLRQDASIQNLIELRSQDLQRVKHALLDEGPTDPTLIPQVIRLLAWDEASPSAHAYLARCEGSIAGQLSDALTNPDVDFVIRRRIPRLLARLPIPTAVEGLLQGLQDGRFEVRFQCGRALESFHRRHPETEIRSSAVLSAVERELSVSKAIWKSWRVLEQRDSSDDYNFLDEILRERADHCLEHVFSLLAVVLPREPLMAAFRALHQEDRMYRGLALEYLENILPETIRRKMWVILDEEAPTEGGENTDQHERVLEELLVTDARLIKQLKAVREARKNPS